MRYERRWERSGIKSEPKQNPLLVYASHMWINKARYKVLGYV